MAASPSRSATSSISAGLNVGCPRRPWPSPTSSANISRGALGEATPARWVRHSAGGAQHTVCIPTHAWQNRREETDTEVCGRVGGERSGARRTTSGTRRGVREVALAAMPSSLRPARAAAASLLSAAFCAFCGRSSVDIFPAPSTSSSVSSSVASVCGFSKSILEPLRVGPRTFRLTLRRLPPHGTEGIWRRPPEMAMRGPAPEVRAGQCVHKEGQCEPLDHPSARRTPTPPRPTPRQLSPRMRSARGAGAIVCCAAWATDAVAACAREKGVEWCKP